MNIEHRIYLLTDTSQFHLCLRILMEIAFNVANISNLSDHLIFENRFSSLDTVKQNESSNDDFAKIPQSENVKPKIILIKFTNTFCTDWLCPLRSICV